MESHKHIESLVEKYLEAETSLAEEKELQAYFAQEQIAPHLVQYQPMFSYFANAKKETFTKQIPSKPSKKRNFGWLSTAAAVVVAIGVYFGQDTYRKQQEQKRIEQEQAMYAYQETKKALNLLAENFSKGTEKIAYLKEFEASKQKIYKTN
ncbi:hypothetical protein [Croceivirga sp. JEA036]|uniref:hypothetical protein n=1 Tax=Croceivirga sp. JEA036 TaxID=2721162 RepID=UPI001438AA54|nr:hypothetical protein [Croceivirga sp. JEA036]NJB37921.1 hypothetical protein [Croceivirga sp. JEA036]